MQVENTSVLLEIVSFFCVTLDLYGKERLKALSKKFHQFANYVKSISLAKPIWKNIRAFIGDEQQPVIDWRIWKNTNPFPYIDSWFFVITGLIFIPVIVIAAVPVWNFVTNLALLFENPLANFLFQLFLIFLILGLLEWAALISFGAIILVLELLIDGVLFFSIFLLERMKLEGLLLVIGTILFLTSKLIILVD